MSASKHLIVRCLVVMTVAAPFTATAADLEKMLAASSSRTGTSTPTWAAWALPVSDSARNLFRGM